MRWLLLALPLVLTGCLEEGTVSQDGVQKSCFELTPISSGPPSSPILWDKCTGETWIILKEPIPAADGKPSPGFSYGWYRMERWAAENTVSAP